MGVLLPADVRCNCGLKTMLAELLKHGGAKLGIVQRRSAKPNQGIAMVTFEPVLKRMGHPQSQEPEDSAGLLESRQTLPLSLEDRENARMEGICRRKSIAGAIERELLGHLLAMVLYPVSKLIAGGNRIRRGDGE